MATLSVPCFATIAGSSPFRSRILPLNTMGRDCPCHIRSTLRSSNADVPLDSTVPGTSQEREELRGGLDLFARGCDIVYIHTRVLCAPAVPYADSDPFGQFRDPAIALAWTGGKHPPHEGAAVLRPRMAKAYRQLGYVLTLGGDLAA